MTEYFFFTRWSKANRMRVLFSDELQTKLSELAWEKPNRNPIHSDWKILGNADWQGSAKPLSIADYLPAFVSLHLLSDRAAHALATQCGSEIDFVPCYVSHAETEVRFNLLRTHRFLPLIDHALTQSAEAKTKLAPTFLKSDIPDEFFVARDDKFRTTLVLSAKAVEVCERNNLNIEFSAFESYQSWISRQPLGI
jgi:hypothetical protein